jgi:hypothetical protein
MQAKVDGAAAARLRDQQLVALQGRLEALSAAKLLTDDELFAVEDVIADSTGSGEASGDDQVTMSCCLSAIGEDGDGQCVCTAAEAEGCGTMKRGDPGAGGLRKWSYCNLLLAPSRTEARCQALGEHN